MKKIYFFGMCLLATLFFVQQISASTPDFSVTNNLNQYMEVGSKDVGQLIISPRPYIADQLNLSTINETNAQKYDIFLWQGNGSIRVLTPMGDTMVMTVGQTLPLSITGQYTYAYLSNLSVSGHITVIAESQQNVQITYKSDPVTYSYINNQALNVERVVNFTAYVSNAVPTGNYNTTFYLTNGKVNRTISHVFIVKENKNLSFVEDTVPLNFVMESGSYNNTGYVKLFSDSNVNYDITTSVTGNASQFINIQQKQTVFKQNYAIFNLLYQVQSRQVDGVYNATIQFSNGDKILNKSVSITVRDVSVPQIVNVTFSDENVTHLCEVKIETKDNIGVSNVTLNYNGTDVYPKNDQNFWYYKTKFMTTAQYNIIVCAYDFANNKACQTIQKIFSPLNISIYNKTIMTPTKKAGRISDLKILELTEQPPSAINVTLVSFLTDLTTYNWTDVYIARIIDGDGSVKELRAVNSTVSISQQGTIYFQVQGRNVSEFNAVLSFKVPAQMQSIPQMNVKGKFVSWDVPTSFNRVIGDYKTYCDVDDTGDVETSQWNCQFRAPITVDLEHMGILTTVKELDLMVAKHNQTVEEYKKEVGTYQIVLGSMVALFLLAVITLIIMVKLYPIARFRSGGKNE